MKEKTIQLMTSLRGALKQVGAMIREDTNEAVKSGDHVAVIKHYNDVRTAAAFFAEIRDAVRQIEDSLSREGVPDAMRNANVRTVTIEGIGRVSLSQRYSCSMLDKPRGMEWLQNNGAGGLIIETVNSSSLAAYAKDRLINEGFELPGDLFKTSTMTYTSITKAGVIDGEGTSIQ